MLLVSYCDLPRTTLQQRIALGWMQCRSLNRTSPDRGVLEVLFVDLPVPSTCAEEYPAHFLVDIFVCLTGSIVPLDTLTDCYILTFGFRMCQVKTRGPIWQTADPPIEEGSSMWPRPFEDSRCRNLSVPCKRGLEFGRAVWPMGVFFFFFFFFFFVCVCFWGPRQSVGFLSRNLQKKSYQCLALANEPGGNSSTNVDHEVIRSLSLSSIRGSGTK